MSHPLARRAVLLAATCLAGGAGTLRAGYEAPNHIDPCQSADGRYRISAECVEKGRTAHGPNKWKFVWQDSRTGETRAWPAAGVQSGQVHAHLYIAPDGTSFALWNHVTLWSAGRSEMHGPKDIRPIGNTPAWRGRSEFTRRIIVYDAKDGSIRKELGVADLLRPEEWESVQPVFNRVHWIREYDGLRFKQTARSGWAFHRISPDYTVLEFRVPIPKSRRVRNGPDHRVVRVRLTDGTVLPENEALNDRDKVPVRPWVGPDHLPDNDHRVREGFVPAWDPVRVAGKFTVAPAGVKPPGPAPADERPADAADASPAAEPASPVTADPKPAETKPGAGPLDGVGALTLVKEGFRKADTPAWLPSDKVLVLTDLDAGKLFRLDADGTTTEVLAKSGRGTTAPDGRFVGALGERLASWRPGEEPEALPHKPAGDRPLSLNDITAGVRGRLYFTTLKDPDKGRLTLVDTLGGGTATVLFDGEKEPGLANPNGVALSPEGDFLYVGISAYKNRKVSGVYRFPVLPDGTIDLAAGKTKPWAPVAGPDGIAVDSAGNVWFTAGNAVMVVAPDGKRLGSVKIPKGSGTNLCFGGEDLRTLYVTTNEALWSARVPIAGTRQ